MARLHTIGWETGAITEGNFQTIADSANTSIDTGAKEGGSCLKLVGTTTVGQNVTYNVTGSAGTTYFVRVWFKFAAGSKGGAVAIWCSGTYRLNAWLDFGSIFLSNSSGTNISPGNSFAVSADTWYLIELSLTIGTGATDAAELRVNGTTVASLTGQSFGDTNVSAVALGFANSSNTGTHWYDSLKVNDSTGSAENSWPNAGVLTLAHPIADSSVGTGWQKPGGATTNLYTSVDNAPPVGVADSTSSAQAENQIRNASANTTYTVQLESYTEAGASGTINGVHPFVFSAAPVATGAKTGSLGLTANPSQTAVSIGNYHSGTNAGTFPTGWKWSNGPYTGSPTVTLGTRPTLALNITGGTASRIALACALGAYYEYTESAGSTITSTSSLGAAVQATVTRTSSLGAAVLAQLTAGLSANMAIAQNLTAAASVGAAVQAGNTSAASAGAAVQEARSASPSTSLAVRSEVSAQSTLAAAIAQALSASSSAGMAVQSSATVTANLVAAVQAALSSSSAIGAAIRATASQSADLQTAIQASQQATAQAGAAIMAAQAAQAQIEAAIQVARTALASMDMSVTDTPSSEGSVASALSAAIQAAQNVSASLSAAISQAIAATAGADMVVRADRAGQAHADAAVQAGGVATAGAELAVQRSAAASASTSAAVQTSGSSSASAGAAVQAEAQAQAQAGLAVQAPASSAASVSTAIQDQAQATASAGLAVQAGGLTAAGIDGVIRAAQQAISSLTAAILGDASASASLGMFVQGGQMVVAGANAAVQAALQMAAGLSAAVAVAGTAAAGLGAAIAEQISASSALSLAVRAAAATFSALDLMVLGSDLPEQQIFGDADDATAHAQFTLDDDAELIGIALAVMQTGVFGRWAH